MIKFKTTNLGKTLQLLTKQDKLKLLVVVLIQVVMSVLDLFGVISIGALGALSIQGIESHASGNKVSAFLNFLNIGNFSFHSQVAVLGALAAAVFICKTVFSVYFTRKIFFFLSYKGAEISADLTSRVLSQNLINIQRRSSQELLYILSNGVGALMNGLLATSINLISDFSMMIVMFIGLAVVDPIVAFSTLLLFLIVGITLNHLLRVRAVEIGRSINYLSVINNEKILEVLDGYRESVVHNRRHYYAKQIRGLKYKLSGITAEANFQPYISKYVIESGTILGVLALSGFEFSTKNAVHAFSTLAVFLAATSRIAPAALRIQQGVLLVKNTSGSTESTFRLIDDLDFKKPEVTASESYDFSYEDFIPSVTLRGVSFSYPGARSFSLEGISLDIAPGSVVALVGPSGAGKTTLADIILGILEPSAGSVQISGDSPHNVINKWPGAISYVPQSSQIISGTVRQNVSAGYPAEIATDFLVNKALKLSGLEIFLSELPSGLDTPLGENGFRISGGQRQRVGIARALFTSPKLLVLDEATSSLDSQTEKYVSESISELSGNVTRIIIAHRLATIQMADQVVYLENGKIIASGTFKEVRMKVPNFDAQAKLMGL